MLLLIIIKQGFYFIILLYSDKLNDLDELLNLTESVSPSVFIN